MELLHRQPFFMKHFAAMPQNMKRILRCMKRHCVPWSKAWRLVFLTPPSILNCFLRRKTQNFAVKSNSEKRFNFVQKNSESFLPSHIPVYQRQPWDIPSYHKYSTISTNNAANNCVRYWYSYLQLFAEASPPKPCKRQSYWSSPTPLHSYMMTL